MDPRHVGEVMGSPRLISEGGGKDGEGKGKVNTSELRVCPQVKRADGKEEITERRKGRAELK